MILMLPNVIMIDVDLSRSKVGSQHMVALCLVFCALFCDKGKIHTVSAVLSLYTDEGFESTAASADLLF